jgi:hypothetical protein
MPCHPIPSHPIPSHPIPSHPIPSHPIPSHPIPSHPPTVLPSASTAPHRALCRARPCWPRGADRWRRARSSPTARCERSRRAAPRRRQARVDVVDALRPLRVLGEGRERQRRLRARGAARRVAHAAPPHNMTRGVHSAHRDTPHPNITPLCARRGRITTAPRRAAYAHSGRRNMGPCSAYSRPPRRPRRAALSL